MTRAISTTPSTSRPLSAPATSPVESQVESSKPAVAAPVGDRLQIGSSPREPLLEADLRLKVVSGARIVANGQVNLNRTFVERLIRYGLSQGDAVSNAQVSFDPTRRAYSVRASATMLGMTVPFTVDLKPEVIGQGVGFKLDNLRIPLGDSGRFGIQHRWITAKVSEELAKELSWSLGAKAHPDQGVVTLNPNSLLHHAGALPRTLGVDLAQTQLRTEVSAEGNLTLGSDLINAGKLLTALIGMSAGNAQAANLMNERTRLMFPLDLDVSLSGTELRVKPSVDKALGEIAKTFEAAGLKPVQEGDRLRVELSPLLMERGTFEAMQIRPDGLQVQMALDLDAFISSPALADGAAR